MSSFTEGKGPVRQCNSSETKVCNIPRSFLRQDDPRVLTEDEENIPQCNYSQNLVCNIPKPFLRQDDPRVLTEDEVPQAASSPVSSQSTFIGLPYLNIQVQQSLNTKYFILNPIQINN